jgi:uncharacterized repeat protein (TIGR04076 family)
MMDEEKLGLNLDLNNMFDEDYRRLWGNLRPVEVKLVEQCGQCRHKLGDTFTYETPYKRPEGLCYALAHTLELYTWRATLGYPSWNLGERDIYRIHCPDATGTVWEMRRLE